MLELPYNTRIYVADAQDAEMVDKVNAEPLFDVYVDEHERQDYWYDRSSRTFKYPVKSILINSMQFDLTPGKNQVPQCVVDFLEQQKEAQRKVKLLNDPANFFHPQVL